MATRLEGKSVLVTGGAKGIGLAAAEEFARLRCRLVITDIDPAALEEAATRLRAHGASVSTYVVDVADKAQVDAMAEKVLQEMGGALDVLVNNAGIGHNAELESTSFETWRQLVDVNFWGPLYHVYAFLPSMKARRAGHIVNVSSGQAFFKLPTWGAYAVTKLAIAGFSEILGVELKNHGIKVSTVYPFMTATAFYDGVEAKTFAAKMSMKLMPYYGDSAEKVGRLIVRTVRRGKKVEMVSLLNDVGFYSQFAPPVKGIVSRVGLWIFSGK